jgi:hypothetical protein
LSAFSGLAFGSDSRLYASRFHLAQVWRFDGTSGQFLGSLSCPGDQHLDYLAFGPDHRLYVSNVDGNNLSRFDVQTGQCLGVFLTGGGINGCKGFVFLPAAPPIVYCVPKTNSLGCIPTIGFSGTPALSGPDDFAISASNVLNFRPGLMFWGRAASSIPFQGGTRCVAMPFMRTRLQDSEGSPGSDNCSGTYNYELTNEYLVANALNPGDQMYAQYWSRDPFSAPFFTGLTDALHIWIGP